MDPKSKVSPSTRQVGNKQEGLACQYLQRQGLKLVLRNYLCNHGEIDLVMIDSGQFLVFVEIRFRSQQAFGDAIASVTSYKQQKIRRTAAHYLMRHPRMAHFACRFDVVGISRSTHSSELRFEWIRNAFM